ncbi:DNA-binding transcriptional regulator, MerR family [Devosia lucknowensis]|uniref:DNA-binding transcriptional regulator, MerR family n=1 Tax=Devosia lucknowensis TaxID=1096929 RepID=A0A1Y6ETU1_9HYPH|nr:MerR family transcriptional regulator [Devosia lucknowensis]SMQ66158.1 DNA-binding transcriptional regulator, MerR family [Devosia lucknowensis]
MKTYTVKQLARLAGVSVRTLHHYDDVGLLKPAFTGDNRYRYYGEEELLRLQQILIHRELDIPLADIGAILDAPGFDRLTTLREQRQRLERQARRFAGMVRTIDRTIARIQGETDMTDADLYSGIVSPEKQAEYEAWLVQHFGSETKDHLALGRKAMDELAPAEMAGVMAELRQIENALAEGFRRGMPPQAAALDPMIERHRDWVARSWGRECPPEAYSGLADVYEHPDFRLRYEAIEPGFADYLVSAMRAWARRQH